MPSFMVSAIILLFFISPALGEEILLFGTVSSIDPETGNFRMNVARTAHGYTAGDQVSVAVADRSLIKIDEIAPGSLVRVWVERSREKQDKVLATRIGFPGQCMGGMDRTGVRGRLMRGRGTGRGPCSEEGGAGPYGGENETRGHGPGFPGPPHQGGGRMGGGPHGR